MSTVNLTRMYDDVLPDLPGCPPLIALNAIRNAAIEFCEITRIYRVDLTPIIILANTPTYAYAGMPSGTVVHEPLHSVFGTSRILPKAPDDLQEQFGDDWRTKTGTPLFIVGEDERTVRVVPYPTADLSDTLKLWVAIKPSDAATTIEQRLFEEYRTVIADGAKALLMASPKKTYTDKEMAAFYAGKFNVSCSSIQRRAGRGFLRSRPRVKARFL